MPGVAATAAPFLRRRSRFRATCALIALGERETNASSGAWREEALPGAALGGIAMSILTFSSGNGGAKF